MPYGAGSGPVLVRTPQGETVGATQLKLRTSVSGIVDDNNKEGIPKGIPKVKVSVEGTSITTDTDPAGRYILPDVSAGDRVIRIDPSTLPKGLNYPTLSFKVDVIKDRGNEISNKPLQQVTGPGMQFTTPGSTTRFAPDLSFAAAPSSRSIQTGGVTLEVADNATAIFPNGATSGSVFLSIVENSRVPAKLQPGIFSSTVAMLTPIGTKLRRAT